MSQRVLISFCDVIFVFVFSFLARKDAMGRVLVLHEKSDLYYAG